MTTPPKQWYLPLGNCTNEQLEICNEWRIKQHDCIYLNAKLNNTYSLISKHYNDNSYYYGCELDKHIYLNEYYKDYVKITYDQFFNWFVEPKYNYELIQKLSNGDIAVKFDDKSKLEKLRDILKIAFPEDSIISVGSYNFYQKSADNGFWATCNNTKLIHHSISDFIINPNPNNQMTHPTKEQIIQTANKSPEIKIALTELYPELFPVNNSVEILENIGRFTNTIGNTIASIRTNGKYKNKSIYLNSDMFDFEIIKDDVSAIVLVPTLKK